MPSSELAKNDDRFNDDHQFEFIVSESVRLNLREYNADRRVDKKDWKNGTITSIFGVTFCFFVEEGRIAQAEEELFAVLSLHDGYSYSFIHEDYESAPFFECLFDVKLQLMNYDEDGTELLSIINELSIKDVQFYGGRISPVKLHIGHQHSVFDPMRKLDISDGIMAILTVTMKKQRGVVPCILSSFSSPSKLTDLKITVGDTVFYANKSIIAMSSPILSSLIYPGPLEIVNELFIEDVTPHDFEILLKCIYPENYKITQYNIFSILTLAGRFNVDHVMRKCVEVLKAYYNRNDLGYRYYLAEYCETVIQRIQTDAMKQWMSSNKIPSIDIGCILGNLRGEVLVDEDKVPLLTWAMRDVCYAEMRESEYIYYFGNFY